MSVQGLTTLPSVTWAGPKGVPPFGDSLDGTLRSIVGESLSLEAFSQLAGNLAGTPFVKLTVDRETKKIHFINAAAYQFHADYIAETILGIAATDLNPEIDSFNRSVYLDPDRRFLIGILALQRRGGERGSERFFTLETVEIDNMDAAMVREFYDFVKANVDASLPLLFKPANHLQERIMSQLAPAELPRVFSHELFAQANYLALNPGRARGRLRAFRTEEEYRRQAATLEWYDIIAMNRVPDDIPRLAGIINAEHTTPLSHTNVLASGWKIPNSIQIGVFERIEREKLDGRWVNYEVASENQRFALLEPVDAPTVLPKRPAWSIQRIELEEPETVNVPIVELSSLRMGDRHRYGTKAANLGELTHLLYAGSDRLLGFYRVRRPPRANLLPHLARLLELPEAETIAPAALAREALQFLRANIQVPRGVALPFSVQQEFLESSPRMQQAIGKLKMALELDAHEIDSLCLALQSMIRATRMPDRIRGAIDSRIAEHLGGVSSFVVRSSSNAEDLEGFSAAGIYESINHVTTADNVFQSIKEVWASLLSPRSVRLRHEVGISLDSCYMGVIIQEEAPAAMGGVLVTTNPMNRGGDFRNVYINAALAGEGAVEGVVSGAAARPYQFLYNTVEGGGRTLSIGDGSADIDDARKAALQRLALAGRLLQSHFSPDYTFAAPVDIEWVWSPEGLSILQLRPYSK